MLVNELARFVHATDYASLPGEVRASVKRSIIDTVGVAAGAVDVDTSRALLDAVRPSGALAPCEVFSGGHTYDASRAALLNGTLAHTLDFDDTHLPTILHPSACVVPSALAAAQLRGGATFSEFMAAVACGSEVSIRIAMAGFDRDEHISRFVERGWHPTSVCGVLGSAAAAAKMRDLDIQGLQHALSIAVSMASGVIEPNRSGGNVKRIHAGWAAHSGVIAAELAASGFTGPASALEGRFGLFAAFISGAPDPGRAVRELGDVWDVKDVGIKAYPCNIFTHSVIEAAVQLRQYGFTTNNVKDILVQVPSAVVSIVGEPSESKRQPASGHEARFSVPYVVAAALAGGSGLGVGREDFSEVAITRPERLALASRVSVTALQELDINYPERLPAVVTITDVDGKRHSASVEHALGSPLRPMSDEQLRAKFVSAVEDTFGRDAAVQWLGQFDSMDGSSPMDAFLGPLSSRPPLAP